MKNTLKIIATASLLASFAASAATGWVSDKGVIGTPPVVKGDITSVATFEKEDGKLVFSVMMASKNKNDTVGSDIIEVDAPIMVNGKNIIMKAEAVGQIKSYNPKTEQGTQYILNEFKTKDGVVIENITYPTKSFNQAFKALK
ncbi:hypothetical protein [Photobacterium kishitanii]|uniref:Uncharacterized protein n=1 Tax=Photobacterium kishitanii TaxID=318456 RepID=A0A2T3KL84_9GAMM|nr:hypothetical protein [Photobacterium kishitanii]PSV00407.1 hypothetical protein C9J27_04565 [Photobacterium kishitanii]